MARPDPLPKVGDKVTLSWDTTDDITGEAGEDISGDYIVLAVDLNELLWTVFNRELQRIELFTFDENGHYQRCLPAGWVKEDDDDEG
jgi:hypothetical protein